ncbi:MAG: ribonuclease D [Alphaproteobacteria bacterium]
MAENTIKTYADMQVKLHLNDLPADIAIGDSVAIDTETLGLNPLRDRLCLVQLTFGDGIVHLVQFDGNNYSAPNLSKILTNKKIVKIFHFARFDVAVLYHYLGVQTVSVYCTKIASKLTRTYTDRHGLKNLVAELLEINLNKQQQSSDWAAPKLSEEQKEYASNDVIYLHQLKIQLDKMLDREGRWDLAKQSFKFIMTRAILDLKGFDKMDIFSHT